jgi:hypothetical protein
MRLLAVVIQALSAAVLLLPVKLREVPAAMNRETPAVQQRSSRSSYTSGRMHEQLNE